MLSLAPYEPHLDRHSSTCTWSQFCERLYEVLWRRAEGYTSTADLLHDLYTSSKICGIVVAQQRGFPCFEELINSQSLEHVVTIERLPSKDSNFIKYRYRASLTNQFQDIRRRVRQRRRDVYILSSDDEEMNTNKVKNEGEEQFFNFDEESVSKSNDVENTKLFEREEEDSYSESEEIKNWEANSEKGVKCKNMKIV